MNQHSRRSSIREDFSPLRKDSPSIRLMTKANNIQKAIEVSYLEGAVL